MLNHLSSPPPQITQEQHDVATSSTPAEFDRNPPILRFQDEVEVTLEPADGFNYSPKTKGQIWVTESAVSFLPADNNGWTLPFPSITLHALTPSSGDSPAHIYLQVDESDVQANGEAEDEYTPMREIRIYLSEGNLQSLFDALSRCSALHLSLMPNGQPSSFFGFGDDEEDDDEDYEDMDQEGDEDDDQGEEGEDTGRGEMDRFLDMVDWGNVQKPAEWSNGQYDDA